MCKDSALRPEYCPASSERETLTVYTGLARRSGLPWSLGLATGEREEEELPVLQLGTGQNCYPKETVLVEGEEVEAAANWETVPDGCLKLNVQFPEVPAEVVFYGSQEVAVINGVKNGLSPSRLQFDEAGALDYRDGGEDAAANLTASLTGELKLEGTHPGPELITVR